MGTYFDQLISKDGETISHYVHSFETDRDGTTNLKESKWAAAVSISGVVRTQPKVTEQTELGIMELESIIVLTKTAAVQEDVLKWNNKYFDVTGVEEVFFKGASQYYKATCLQRMEFLGN